MTRPGDIANAFVLVNAAVFFAAVLIAHSDNASFPYFDQRFLREGFCVANKDVALVQGLPLLQSHILCFYADTVAAAVLLLLGWKYGPLLQRRGVVSKGRDAFQPVAAAPAAIFSHGAAHLALWFQSANVDPAAGSAVLVNDASAPSWARGLAMVGAFAFFFLLLRSAPAVPPTHAAAHAMPHAIALVTVVPPVFGFSYVQTVLLWVAAGYDLFLRPASEKDASYDLFSCVVTAPIGLVAWVEAAGCDLFMSKLGGHVLYDATIPTSMLVYYFLALRLPMTSGDGAERLKAA